MTQLRAIALAGPSTPSRPETRAGRRALVQEDLPWDADRSLLEAMLPSLKTAVWEAYQDSLRLISLRFGKSEKPIIAIDESRIGAGTYWNELICPLDLERAVNFLVRPDGSNSRRWIDYRIVTDSGELLWIRHHILQRIPDASGQMRLRGLVTAIHEQKHLEWECLRVSERECNRIGQELHDDLCQVLAGLSYMMQVIGRRAAKTDPALGKEINGLNASVADAMERTRSMAHGLFPAQLNYATLRHALKEFVRQTRTRMACAIELDLPKTLPRHSAEQIIHIYRITQEAVANSVRHGNATVVRIVALLQPTSMRFSIEDNGKGLPATSSRPEGIGMHVMSYRARVLGGEIEFRNRGGGGACVQLSYPIAVSRYGANTR